LSTTSSRLMSTSRRLRSASFASSLRIRARASSNSRDAWRYFARYSSASFSRCASFCSSSSTYVGFSAVCGAPPGLLSPSSRQRRRSTTFTETSYSFSSAMVIERERQRIGIVPDGHRAAVFQLAEEDLVGEPIAHFRLDDARERTGAKDRVEALLREICSRRGLQRDRDAAFGKLLLELDDEIVDDRLHHVRGQRLEVDDRVETVPELRTEHPFDGGFRSRLRGALAIVEIAALGRLAEPDAAGARLARSCVRRHD